MVDKAAGSENGGEHSPDAGAARALRDALGRFATGVTLVTTLDLDTGAALGMVANSFASVSLDPPLVLWSAALASQRHRHFAAARGFSIHVLGADHRDIAGRFGRSGPGFEGLAHRAGATGAPVLEGVPARFDCALETTYPGGDHTIILGRVMRFALAPEAAPLCFFGGSFGGFHPEA